MISAEAFEGELAARLSCLLTGEGGPGRPAPVNLSEAIRYSLLAAGKRIRPRLALATADLAALPEEVALGAAVAVEMVHCFTLIHDDLPCMDNDEFRRGLPTSHRRFGEGLALLAGDALLALAIDALLGAAARVPGERGLTALRRLAAAAGPRGVIGGQAAELLLTRASTVEDLRDLHSRKTGALFEAAIGVPADLAGVSPGSARGLALFEFAAELGSAFQVADDLGDAEQDSRSGPVELGGSRGETGVSATSILHYLPSGEARSLASAALRTATARLAQEWGPASTALRAIADEVLRSL